ncbi:hypothetical protein Fot_11159 [Forsythia ovata]|uniref:Uncharacterized protein n=1 Tax=Forsythia ovata TaxID=205694 RepID=A0ABD1WIX1_9LAMI
MASNVVGHPSPAITLTPSGLTPSESGPFGPQNHQPAAALGANPSSAALLLDELLRPTPTLQATHSPLPSTPIGSDLQARDLDAGTPRTPARGAQPARTGPARATTQCVVVGDGAPPMGDGPSTQA